MYMRTFRPQMTISFSEDFSGTHFIHMRKIRDLDAFDLFFFVEILLFLLRSSKVLHLDFLQSSPYYSFQYGHVVNMPIMQL